MIVQGQDSIHTETITAPDLPDLMEHIPTRPQTPYQVLRLLPKDATPAQQDSAIQAWFQPGEIHYSSEPDTLHLPGHDKGRNLKEVNIPQYYRENYFSNDTLFHPELNGGRFGMAGDPVPYATRNDNIISSLLIICFILTVTAYAASKNFIQRQVKDFFQTAKADTTFSETSNEVWFQFFFMLQTCLLLALMYFFYVRLYVADTYILSDEYLLPTIFFGVICTYYLLKFLSYTIANVVLFDGKRNRQLLRSLIFLHSAAGVLLFPSVIAMSYFDIGPQTIIYYVIFVAVLVKILTFYKCYAIFFRQNDFYLQIILYFCTLEIVPFFALWGGLTAIVNALKINF